jgi:hypothetical protein
MPFLSLDDHLPGLHQGTKEVLRGLARASSNAQIADALCLSVPGVRSRLQAFYPDYDVDRDFAISWSARHEDCCLPADGDG